LSDRPLRSRLRVAERDLSALSREKTIVLALLIQLFVAAFSSFLVVGLTSLYAPGAVEGGEVTVAVVGDASDEFVEAAGEVEGLVVAEYDSLDTATGAFEVDQAQAVVETRTDDGRIRVTATAPASSLRKTVAVVRLREALEVLERTERVERSANIERSLVPLPPAVDASPYLGFSYTVLVPLLLFLPVFISGSVAVDSVTEEVERGTLELLRVSPLSLAEIVEGKGLAAAALAPAQAALWVALLSVNGIPVSNVPSLLVFVTALSLLAVGVGVGVALAVPDRQRAQLLYSLGVLGAFASAAFLPEPPATTAARLAIDSPAASTLPSVVVYALLAVVVVGGLRKFVSRLDPESL
jgi:ABC-type Na+ efflux pump permease subunit